MNIVSLLPSATELVYALGLEPVAVSHECDYPPEATEKPTVVRSRVDASAGSTAINEQVAAAVEAGGVYELDRDALRAADPDLVLSQGVCDVCAVETAVVAETIESLDLDCEVFTTDPHSVGDVLADLERLGRATGREERAREVRASLEARIDAVRERAPDGRPHVAPAPRVAVLDWTDPVMVAGHWVPELVEWAGCEYSLAVPGQVSYPREWSQIREYDPEVLVVAPCGFGLDQIDANRADLLEREGWADLTAVREGRVYALDGHHYVNRPGPRLVDTLEHLAGLLHPDEFAAPPADVARRF
jgi:iron complex transport system substrate-binding protein